MNQEVFADGLLAGKHALITGGGSGINLGIAKRFARAGASITIVGRTQAKLDQAAQQLQALGARAAGQSADVRNFDALGAAFDAGVAQFGPLDIVIAGAAGNFLAPAVGISPNGFKSVIEIDLNGTFHTFRHGQRCMRSSGGAMIAISATQSFQAMPLQAHVCSAKAGIDQLVRVLAMEWAPNGIRMMSIAPGPIEGTEGMDRLTPGDAKAKLIGKIPMRRYGTADEIALMALFLVSPAASYITGQSFVVDGGQSLVGGGLEDFWG